MTALGDVLPNDPNPCAPRLHPLNEPPGLLDDVSPLLVAALAGAALAFLLSRGSR